MLTSVLAVAVFAAASFAAQLNPIVDGPHIDPPAGVHTTGSTTNVTNTTNVFPAPSREEVIAIEGDAAPVILVSGFRALDMGAADSMNDFFRLALTFAQFRTDMLDLPMVQDINHGMTRIVQITLGLVIAALAMWGILSRYVGSDIREAFETLARVPLWAIMAMTSLQWYRVVLQGFAQLAGAVSTVGDGAFGPALRSDFWSNTGLGIFALFVGLFMFILLLMFFLQFLSNTAFLLVCAVVAPVFVFLKSTPWTQHLGTNWFKMVPATVGDTIAMLCILMIGAAGFSHITAPSAFATICLDIGLLMCLPLVKRLFGLEHHSAGSKLFAALAIGRMVGAIRGGRGGGGVQPTGGSDSGPATSPTTPTQAPRWSTSADVRAVPNSAAWADNGTDHGVGPVRWAQPTREDSEDPERITTRGRRMNNGDRVWETERMA